MKKLLIILMLTNLLIENGTTQNVRLITYNIRYDNPMDGENNWNNRKEDVVALLKFHQVDVFGLQEALYNQVTYIEDQMPSFDRVGVGRDNGKAAGEYSPIFYNSRKYQLKSHGWFWLSTSPNVPSKSWDAALPRICTYVLLEDYDKHHSFWVFNTHFDHIGELARDESARLILYQIETLNEKGFPVFLMGDFNLTPETKPIARIEKAFFDSKKSTLSPAYGPEGTFNGFDFNSPLDQRIDYIFVQGKSSVLEYGVLTDSKNNRYPSDHLPVLVEATLR
ncbi:endonuclease/exonuclease/phosphatase family protein [Sunxiuqinia sp. A32]|uniref:endonuclease/exonuclease/phosphatase family protein n=1 Tax=Sunxiuqinia sp. A32 TaxID=3461496 RepID=UPI0040457B76